MLTLMTLGGCVKHILVTKQLMPLLISCNANILKSQSHDLCVKGHCSGWLCQFSKNYVAMEPGDNHHDFSWGFWARQKGPDQAVAKKPVGNKVKWIQVFGAWAVGVKLAYPHHKEELQKYCCIVMELFCAVPSVATAKA